MPKNRCCLTSRGFFAVILVLGFLSLLFNYQVSYYGTNMAEQRLPVERQDLYQSDKVRFLEKKEVTNALVFRRSLREHRPDNGLLEPVRIPEELTEKIHEVERRLLNTRRRVVALTGSNRNDTGLIERLKQFEAGLVQKDYTLSFVRDGTSLQGNWSETFCFGNSHCPNTVLMSQKVDMIPSLQPFINSPEETCNIALMLEKDRGVSSQFCEESVCTHLPAKTLDETAEQIKVNASVIQFCNRGTKPLEGTTWYLPDKPLMFPEGPLLKIRCLVTSFAPLRLYVHQLMFSGPYEALRANSLFQKVTLEDLLQYISETYGLGTSSRWWIEIQRTLLLYLTYIESLTAISVTNKTNCARCFQSLHADITCNSVQRCRIIQMKNDPSWDSVFIDDIFSIVSSKQTVSTEVVKALEDVISSKNHRICRDDINESDGCLSENTVIYLLDWRREMKRKQSWIKVYPSKTGCGELEQMSIYNGPTMKLNHLMRKIGDYLQWTEQVSAESLYLNDGDGDEYSDARVTPFNHPSAGPTRMCSNEPEDFGKIAEIHISPKIGLEAISPKSYNGSVAYHTILVTMWAYPKCCFCQVRLENKYNEPGARNITLGLGENKIMIYVTDSTSQDLDVINTITVSIHRRIRGLVSGQVVGKQHYCTLKQECSLMFDPKEPCGLVESSNFPSSRSPLTQKCTSGDHQGQWFVPCKTCADENTCTWSRAFWQPYDCNYRKISSSSLQQCLKGKKLLFIGDSTNRGISNYIMQLINGSLYDWDKTHTTRSYSNVNRGYTQFAFAYYPHFWLPTDHRPKFSKVIYQLIKSSLPLQNNTNTVLVVGGVHWLARQHIDLIIEALQRKGLSGITKIVKGLGAGFHQPVENVRFVPDSQQTYLQQREADILNYAKTKDFHVVATFNMTVSRYKDFMEGKCACHFHKVSRHGSHEDGYRYSIEGDTNAEYSQILLNQICF